MNILAPTTLINNRYQITRQIGQGGMGAVYEAVDLRLGNTVALKQTLVDGDELERAFEREARLLAGLRYPHLPKVTDYFTDPAGQFLVMEFIPGIDLATLLQQRAEPFPVNEILNWADQLLDALEFLHSQHPPIIHRDIKPQNLKLTPRGEIILLDFGLAKIAPLPYGGPSVAAPSAAPSLFGYTPHYAPLEQIQGTGTDPRSDLYSLAATLHHLLTYGAPSVAAPSVAPSALIQPPNALERVAAAIEERPDPLQPPHTLNPNVPVAVSEVLMRALALNREARPASAAEFRAMLHAATANQISSPTTNNWANTGPTIVVPQGATQRVARGPGLVLPLALIGTLILVMLVAVSMLVRSLLPLAPKPNDFPSPPPGQITAIVELLTPQAVTAIVPTPLVESQPTAVPTQAPTSGPSIATRVLSFGGEGTGVGLFQDARGIALDGAGNIYVSEYETGRIQKFDAKGTYLTSWNVPGETPLLGLAANRAGQVYVARDQKLHIYDGPTGKLISSVEGNNGLGFQDLEVLPDGTLLATAWGPSDDLIYLDSKGQEIKRFTKVISGQTGDAELSMHAAVDGQGQIFALGSFNNAIFRFSPEGKFMNTFGSKGDGPGQFAPLTADSIAVDNQSRVYVADFKGIQIFAPDGRYLDQFKPEGGVRDMVFNDKNELFVVTSSQQVIKFVINGT